MEMRRILSAAASAGFVFAMTSSTETLSRGLPARPIAADDTASFPTSELPDCGRGGKPGRGKVAWVVRVLIAEDTDIRQLRRAIRYEPNDPNGTEDQEDDDEARYNASQENVTDDPDYVNNPFNIDLTRVIIQNNKKFKMYVKIKIIAKDKRYKFYQFNDDHAIAYGDDRGQDMFCSDHVKQNKNGNSVAIFYVRLGEGARFDTAGFYNFALQAKDATTTPALIVIDPKVKNHG